MIAFGIVDPAKVTRIALEGASSISGLLITSECVITEKVEEKAIVQDIILEIQEYTKTLEDGYIPFDSLLDVVNSIYDTDKSTGIILLRNKLLKYKQQNLPPISTFFDNFTYFFQF